LLHKRNHHAILVLQSTCWHCPCLHTRFPHTSMSAQRQWIEMLKPQMTCLLHFLDHLEW
jgi:hypothetical protein